MMPRLLWSRTVVAFACVLALGAYSGSASAEIVDSADDSFTIYFDGNIAGSDVPGLSASAFFDVESLSGNTLVLDVTLTNTSTILWETSRVSAFGFNTGPNVVSASLASSAFSNVNTGGHFPNGFGSIDLCVINNRNNCTRRGRRGPEHRRVHESAADPELRGPITAVELDNFGVRYQSLSSKALGFQGASGTGSPTEPGNPIPEPRSIAMFILGGLLVAALVRKQVLTAR